METIDKLALLNQPMQVEAADEVSLGRVPVGPIHQSQREPSAIGSCGTDPLEALPITTVALPNGRCMPILKSMITSACERNCNYCCFRAGRNFHRVKFQPEEMAGAIVRLTEKGAIQGAFVSSAIAGGSVRTQDKLLDMADILRNRLHYQGYLHLKLMPGVEYDQVLRAMQLADRVSVNLEGANSTRLQTLAPQKVFLEELVQPLRWVEQIRRELPAWKGWKGRWPSNTTQFVVGAAGESDLELLSTAAYLNQAVGLARSYFSGFTPTLDTPFENLTACNPWREHRLYQASFLLRDYGFDVEELPFAGQGDLPLEADPKLLWAREHLQEAPLEINRAERDQLLRIPGFGPKGVQAILQARRRGRLHSLDELKAIGVLTARAAPFILLDGRRPTFQPGLWNTDGATGLGKNLSLPA